MIVTLIGKVIEILLILALSEINCRVGHDLSMRPNMRWQMYLSETQGGAFMHVLIFAFCWPGLMYGDLVKAPKPQKQKEKE